MFRDEDEDEQIYMNSRFNRSRTEAKNYPSVKKPLRLSAQAKEDKQRYRLVPVSSSLPVPNYSNSPDYRRNSQEHKRVLERKLKYLKKNIEEIEDLGINLDIRKRHYRHEPTFIEQRNSSSEDELKEPALYDSRNNWHERARSWKKQPHRPVWEGPKLTLNTPSPIKTHKKLYRLKPKRIYTETPTDSQTEARGPRDNLVESVRWITRSSKPQKYDWSRVGYPRSTDYYRKRALRSYRKFRRVAHAVLFTIYLRRFGDRMRNNRQQFFHRYFKQECNKKLIQVKMALIQASKPLFEGLLDVQNFDYRRSGKDDPQIAQEKLTSLRRLVELELKCVRKALNSLGEHEIVYYLCKHGSFACQYELITREQLDLSCISEQHRCLRADKNLQKSSILSLVLVKLLLYNVMLQPQKLDIVFSGHHDQAMFYSNVKLVGAILYYLMLDVQDAIIGEVPPVYSIGNWRELNQATVRPARSMTLNEYSSSRSLIIGVPHNAEVVEFMRHNRMDHCREHIQEIVKRMHHWMIRHHERIARQAY